MAVRHALLSKLLDGETRIIERLEPERPSTKETGALLAKIGVASNCLIGVASNADLKLVRNLVLSCRNLHRVEVLPVRDFNTLALLRNRSLLLTESAFEEIQQSESGSAQAGVIPDSTPGDTQSSADTLSPESKSPESGNAETQDGDVS